MKEIENRIEIQERIEHYIKGKLSENEIDQLWVTFLDSPEWFDYFMTLLNLHSMGSSSKRNEMVP